MRGEGSINRIFLLLLQLARRSELIRERLDHFVDKFDHVSLVDRSKLCQLAEISLEETNRGVALRLPCCQNAREFVSDALMIRGRSEIEMIEKSRSIGRLLFQSTERSIRRYAAIVRCGPELVDRPKCV